MGTRGPKAKPKSAQAVKYEGGIPACPSWLSKGAKAEFKRAGLMLHEAGVVQKVDLAYLLSYVVSFDEYAQLSKEIADEGPVSYGQTGQIVNPKIRARQIAYGQMTRSASKLGMSAADREKLTLPTPPEPDDPIDEFLKG